MSAVIAWQSQLHIVHYDKRSQLGVLLLVIIYVLLQHIGIGTGVKSKNIRPSQIIPSRFGASQNLPRVDYVDSQNLLLPPRIYPPFQQLYATLPESTTPFQNIPLFSTTICDPPRINLSLPEYTPPPFSTIIILRDPPRIYPSLSEYIPLFNNSMRRSQNLPLLPRIYPLFKNAHLRPSQNLQLPPRQLLFNNYMRFDIYVINWINIKSFSSLSRFNSLSISSSVISLFKDLIKSSITSSCICSASLFNMLDLSVRFDCYE